MTHLRSSLLGIALVVPALAAACGQTQSLAGHPCPCDDGFVCCNDVCVAGGETCSTVPTPEAGTPGDARTSVHDEAEAGDASTGPTVPTASLVLFGGLTFSPEAGVGFLGDTWTWDGKVWTERRVTGPAARASAAAATLQGDAVLFGGTNDATVFGDTWAWSGAGWSEVAAPSGSSPAARESATMAPLGSTALMLYGGLAASSSGVDSLWFWSGARWTAGPSVAGAVEGADLLAPLGGQVVDVNTDPYGFLSTWSGTTWVSSAPIEAGPSWSQRTSSAVASLHGTLVLFGGQDSEGNCLGDTWTYDGGQWTSYAGPAPSAREGVALATLGDVVLLFGGDDCRGNPGNPLGDTWEWSGSSWTQLSVAGPSPRTMAALAAAVAATAPAVDAASDAGTDAIADVTLGRDAGADAVTDGHVAPDAGTDGGVDAPVTACVPDCAGKACGAEDGCHGICQTGTCADGFACTSGTCECSPASCAGCCTATACLTGTSPMGCGANGSACWTCTAGETCQSGSCAVEAPEIVLYGGWQSTGTVAQGLDDSWTFDGTTWTERATVGPTTDALSQWGADRADGATNLNGVVVLFDAAPDGSSTQAWTLTGTQWTLTGAGGPAADDVYPAVASLAGTAVLFGGNDATTWTWSASAWSSHTGPSPGPRNSATMATLGSTVVLFGGNYAGAAQSDTWTWNGSGWTQANVTNPPSARWGSAMATLGSSVVMFGGCGAATLGGDPVECTNDTWVWNGSTWSQVAISGPKPSPRVNHAMATLGSTVVLFGGSASTDAGIGELGDTWTFDGTEWTQLVVSGPSARAGAAMAAR